MPLVYDKQINSNSRILLWKVDESPEEIISSLNISDDEREELLNLKLVKRQKECIGKYLLFQELGITKPKTLDNGKPVIDDGHISISHCGGMVGVVISDKLVGIDIQNETPRLIRIKHKFCNQHELDWVENSKNELKILTRVWSTKEAVFKMYGENILFAEQMKVEFDIKTPEPISCELIRNGTHIIDLLSFEIDGFVVVHTK